MIFFYRSTVCHMIAKCAFFSWASFVFFVGGQYLCVPVSSPTHVDRPPYSADYGKQHLHLNKIWNSLSLFHDVRWLSFTAIKGWKSQYLFIFASTFALKAVSSTDKNPRRQSTRLMTRQTFTFCFHFLKAKRFCWEPRSSSLPQAPPSWYETTLNLPAGLH